MGYAGLQGATQDYTRLHRVTMGYAGLQGATQGYTRLHRVTVGYRGLHQATQRYTRLHRVTRGYTGLHANQNEQDNCKNSVAIYSLSPSLMSKLVDSRKSLSEDDITPLPILYLVAHCSFAISYNSDSSQGMHEWMRR